LTDENLYYAPPYNNIQILYVQNPDVNSIGRALWYAATGNNALWEFHSFASGDGITKPPGGLDILLTPASQGEAAPMLGEMGNSVWGYVTKAAVVTALFGVPAVGLHLGILVAYISNYAPDIVYNHGGADIGAPSDVTKDDWYHEFAHASHFEGLNNDTYWRDNIKYIVDNNGYGDGTAPGAGRCAVIEMWGFHYGPVNADRQYGLNHSLNTTGNPFNQNSTRHIFALEGFVPILPPTTTNAWIPQGVFLDCIDDNTLNPPGVAEGVGAEPILGFTHSNCFSAISTSPPNPTVVRDILTTSFLPPGQTISGVNTLFSLYGF
jgi:hypothetical protein